MKSVIRIFFLGAGLAVLLSSCGRPVPLNDGGAVSVNEVYDVNGVELELVNIEGGSFTMWTQADNRSIEGAPSRYQAVMNGYAIGKAPVSQALWKAVMGSNPASVRNDNLPVDRVTFSDCMKFLRKLSKITGLSFVLPTEAQWAYACSLNKTDVGNKCSEWVSDYYSDEAVSGLRINPAGPESGENRVTRTVTGRASMSPHSKAGGLTFRVAVNSNCPIPEAVRAAFIDESGVSGNSAANETIVANGIEFNMIGVRGGTFRMGGTEEQGKYANEDELPVLEVTVGDYQLGQTEVTAGLWLAVMGILPLGNDEGKPDRPVINVSWYDCQEFIVQLNALTGRAFRLPTEAEWEYAARGGVKSSGYRFSGSNQIGSVAVYADNSVGQKVSDVMTRSANELGLYDMSGNAWEWCQDVFHEYGKEPENDLLRVLRGGSAAGRWDSCRLSNRSKMPVNNVKGTFGFRLAL